MRKRRIYSALHDSNLKQNKIKPHHPIEVRNRKFNKSMSQVPSKRDDSRRGKHNRVNTMNKT
jgi:hypothetical protein